MTMQDIPQSPLNETTKTEQSARIDLWEFDLTPIGRVVPGKSVCQSLYNNIWGQRCKFWRVAQFQYLQSFRIRQLISGRPVYSLGPSICGDNFAISPTLKCPNRNTNTPASLTFTGATGDSLTDKRNNFMPLQERCQSSSLLSQRALNFSLNIRRAAASARALSLRRSSFSSSRNLFLASRNARSVRIFSVSFFHAPELR